MFKIIFCTILILISSIHVDSSAVCNLDDATGSSWLTEDVQKMLATCQSDAGMRTEDMVGSKGNVVDIVLCKHKSCKRFFQYYVDFAPDCVPFGLNATEQTYKQILTPMKEECNKVYEKHNTSGTSSIKSASYFVAFALVLMNLALN